MTDAPVLDAVVLDALVDDMGGDLEVVRELVESFLDEAPRLLAEGRAALAAADAPGVQRAFHTLKSNAATFGAMGLAAAARETEQAAKGGALPSPDAVAAMERLFESAKVELARRFETKA